MSPFFQNASCDPWTPKELPCTLGNEVNYSVNVSTPQDVAEGLKFAREKNVRVVIKNTGHDYMGKSTGKGALGLWMHNLRSIELLNYTSSHYTGPAIRMGAGVRGFEAYTAAYTHGLRIVGGFCPTVGVVGGYTQGGGHSPLSTLHGLGADQTLEWEVVTAGGEHIVASPSQHAELYWALSGGGGGTYCVVISLTVRAHNDGIVGGASVIVPSSGISKEAYWEAFSSWQRSLPALVDSGATAGYAVFKELFIISPVTAPGYSRAEVIDLLETFTNDLKGLNVTYSLNVTSLPSFLDHYSTYMGPLPNGPYTVNQLFGGRLIPRSVVENNNNALVAAVKNITENSNSFLGFVALDVSKAPSGSLLSNAVLPAWRQTLLSTLVQSSWDFTEPHSVGVARANEITDIVVPQLAALTPESGTYLNEADFQLATWKGDLFGRNYGKLRRVKAKYDPEDLFYATKAVGSDAWIVDADGRMCREVSHWKGLMNALYGLYKGTVSEWGMKSHLYTLQNWVEGVTTKWSLDLEGLGALIA
ncbi:hypothetical protein MMC18_009036 [Xylographa bjoerkii]|nr:hypothetical protein [Xylographa bjoerkii]